MPRPKRYVTAKSITEGPRDFRIARERVADTVMLTGNSLAELANRTPLNRQWGKRKLIEVYALATLCQSVAWKIRRMRYL